MTKNRPIAKFVIERNCPTTSTPDQDDRTVRYYPMTASVYLDSGFMNPPCGGRTWLMTEDSFRDNCEVIGLPRNTPYTQNNYVCEHMGTIIQ